MKALLYSQLQEGLRYTLIKSPAVSGADSYQQLCMAAKHEEKRLSELARRQQYLQGVSKSGTKPPSQQPASAKPSEKRGEAPTRSCYNCGSTDHLARQCKKPKTESSGYSRRPNQSTDATAKG